MKPVIGIPNETYKSENYEKAITDHRGEVEILPIHNNKDKVKEFIAKIDGLLLPGGKDIYLDYYDEDPHPRTNCYDNKDRDEFEILLFEEAMEKDIPVFGICRGIQIMNVAMCGGSLYQHIPDQIPEPLPALFPDFPIHKKYGADTQHDIKITTGSRLSQIIGESTAEVNSSHHQAVKVISDELVVTAQSKDGIIEAMEYPSKRFVIGVQYHPERMWKDKNPPLPNREFLEHAKRLFGAFINAASG